MRLWSLHPTYLDTKGLLAVWREGLLALHVLQGKTRGYTNHPQLLRFKQHTQPIEAISSYLHHIADEADQRGYQFRREKLGPLLPLPQLQVTSGQISYEAAHLLKKLEARNKAKFLENQVVTEFKPHPSFIILPGEIESWEKVV